MHMENTISVSPVDIKVDLSPPSPFTQQLIRKVFSENTIGRFAEFTHHSPAQLQTYEQAFDQTLTGILSVAPKDLLQKQSDIELIARECFDILASVDWNKDVYYKSDDVLPIFSTISRHLFTPEKLTMLLRKMRYNSEIQKSYGMIGNFPSNKVILENEIQKVTTIQDEKSLGLIKTDDAWEIASSEYLHELKQVRQGVLEWVRQDNPDKVGKKKYRVRRTVYTQIPDDLHDDEFIQGWYKSKWNIEPNFWSTQIRDLISQVAQTSQRSVAGTTSAVFITEGGAFKGTSTSETDIDTTCLVACDSPAEFFKAFTTISQIFSEKREKLPFGIVDNEPLRFLFCNTYSHDVYSALPDGTIRQLKYDKMNERGMLPYTLRAGEPGVVITSQTGTQILPKDDSIKNEEVKVFVSLDGKDVSLAATKNTAPTISDKDYSFKITL